jgi:predicted O-linked N-acetylglucosamine transferase (SPINDLY family)
MRRISSKPARNSDVPARDSLRQDIETCRRALSVRPADREAMNNLGAALLGLGEVEEAIRMFGKAISSAPACSALVSNYLLALNYSGRLEPQAVAHAHLTIGRSHFASPTRPHPVPPPGKRKLRVGYVCAGFHFHPAAFFMLPLLDQHDRDRFEIFCYANVARPDDYTARIRKAADHWRDLHGVSDTEAARRIRRDRIDILIDRTGHFEGNRLPLFARRPAPVQVTLPGYPATTGVPAIAYRITDAVADPPGTTEQWHSETLVRLSGPFACYAPPANSPTPILLPDDASRPVTFGSFNGRQKFTRNMLELWAALLRHLPNTRLVVHHAFDGHREVAPEFSAPILRVFRQCGVDAARIAFLGCLPLDEHLRAFHQVDLILDTYPYNGMTTTCESLWMGVPVITLAGPHHAARVSASFLTAAGADEWIAQTPQQYFDLALRFGRDRSRLRRARLSLINRVRKCPLFNAKSYTSKLERAYLDMFRRQIQAPVN